MDAVFVAMPAGASAETAACTTTVEGPPTGKKSQVHRTDAPVPVPHAAPTGASTLVTEKPAGRVSARTAFTASDAPRFVTARVKSTAPPAETCGTDAVFT